MLLKNIKKVKAAVSIKPYNDSTLIVSNSHFNPKVTTVYSIICTRKEERRETDIFCTVGNLEVPLIT